MAESVHVSTSALQSTAETVGGIGSKIAGVRAGQQIADAAAQAMSGLACGAAMAAAASRVDEACAVVGSALTKLSDDLRAAASQYDQTDDDASAALARQFRTMDAES
ncbi:type VII secretion target [Mycobacterium sp. LTG2003]